MRTILSVIPSLDYSGLARRLSLLAAHLPRDRFRPHVAVLGFPSPWCAALRATGVSVQELGWQRSFDVRPLLALRQLIHELQPDVLHVWGAAALRAVLLARGAPVRRLVVSGALPPTHDPGWLGRATLRRVGRVIAFGAADAARYRRLGVAADRITVAPNATELARPPDVATAEPLLPAEGRVLLGVGPLAPYKGFRDAVWAFDILNYLFQDLRLVLAGAGADRARVEEFARVTGNAARIHCPGLVADLAPLRDRAMIAWVLGRAGGLQAALEAMAAGRPVLGYRTPELAEVVAHGETGWLIAPGDKAGLARKTRRLLDDDKRRQAFGAAGRLRVAALFGPRAMVDACASAYEAQLSG